MESKVDYEFLIEEYIKSYRLYHEVEETIDIMKKMINKEDIDVLPSEIKYIEKNRISKIVSKLVIKLINRSDKNKDKFISLLPTIVENNMTIKEEDNKKKKFKLNRIGICGILGAIAIGSAVCLLDNDAETLEMKPKKEVTAMNNVNVIPTRKPITNATVINENIKKLQKEKKILEEKKKVLLNYKEIKTINDIYERQKELESLNLTDDDKLYKDCKLSPEIQRFIEEQSIINGLPVDFTFSIIATETRGEFNSTGTESYNGPGDSDLGLTQQNTVSSVASFCKKYNISYDEAYELIRDNDYFNIVSAFLEYDEIRSRFDSYQPTEFAGCYNGWLGWRNKSISRQYVNIFDDYYNNYFNKYHDVETKEEDNKKLSKDIKVLVKKS